ncbi:hypothetical protein EJ05DRAFT_489088 [Pseudovirgaria hyperparasitica]|uniref:Uncharacterized protein n=1 Tax=Pseudovirgaria hyperparasitica TaxID=470096 RepID=A0A6A6VVV0_9PEZI|nr:uncharacterized protein EJ05DRAFT_489088 [Pseudovirgaria hyperparasitica]KAF2754363.1 hypothetical protein EJ05DRAFT_489088 [Pseudovirgaria hyperparasitica]
MARFIQANYMGYGGFHHFVAGNGISYQPANYQVRTLVPHPPYQYGYAPATELVSAERAVPSTMDPSLSSGRTADQKVLYGDPAILYSLPRVPEKLDTAEPLFRRPDGTPINTRAGRPTTVDPHFASLVAMLRASAAHSSSPIHESQHVRSLSGSSVNTGYSLLSQVEGEMWSGGSMASSSPTEVDGGVQWNSCEFGDYRAV